jgi:hypothetical protein
MGRKEGTKRRGGEKEGREERTWYKKTFFFFATLGLELRAFTLSHSAIPFL